MLGQFEATMGISYWVLSPGNMNIISAADSVISEPCNSVPYHQVSLSSYSILQATIKIIKQSKINTYTLILFPLTYSSICHSINKPFFPLFLSLFHQLLDMFEGLSFAYITLPLNLWCSHLRITDKFPGKVVCTLRLLLWSSLISPTHCKSTSPFLMALEQLSPGVLIL